MLYKTIFVFFLIAAFANAYQVANQRMNLKMSSSAWTKQVSKGFGIIGVGATIFGSSAVMMPEIAQADGASSISSVYRARNLYGQKILKLEDAVSRGDFSIFYDKRVAGTFKLFISESTSRNTVRDQEVRGVETALEKDIFGAAKAKDAAKLKNAYAEFVKVADLRSNYKLNEKGLSDNSGFGPTYGTERGYNSNVYAKK